MGVIKQGILGGFSGKVGGLVGTSWKGIAVVKTLPQSVANPKTAGQVNQRAKFSNVVLLATVILSMIIKPLWDRFAQRMSGYNAFCSANVALFTNTYPSVPANFVLSSGKMASTAINAVTAVNGTKGVVISWLNDADEGYKLGTDEAYVLVFNHTQETIALMDGVGSRESLTITAYFADNMATSDILSCYLAFRRSDGTIVSMTGYKNKVVTSS
jgi:hypothetical protein